MAILTINEIIDLIIMTLALGYIFSGYIPQPKTVYRILRPSFNFQTFKYSCLIAAPAVVLHELAHKFVALAFGVPATFKMFPFGLLLGIVLKLLSSPLLIIAPGYVQLPVLQSSLIRIIALAGPLTNLILFLIAYYVLKKVDLSKKWFILWTLTKQINLILFIFNMLPIPPLDGSKVFFG
jgi:Zn-dependent protease